MNIKPPELLAPAGSLRHLQLALHYGADAVYAGVPRWSLRVRGNDFTPGDFASGIALAHRLGKKFYAVLNVIPHMRRLPAFMPALEEVAALGPDALIMADPGLIALAHARFPQLPLHLSVQANTVNAAAVNFWRRAGISRCILSRELSLNEIRMIKEACPGTELEVFVHGAMCIASSGRCLVSGLLAHRSANLGACNNFCRSAFRVRASYGGEFEENGETCKNPENTRNSWKNAPESSKYPAPGAGTNTTVPPGQDEQALGLTAAREHPPAAAGEAGSGTAAVNGAATRAAAITAAASDTAAGNAAMNEVAATTAAVNETGAGTAVVNEAAATTAAVNEAAAVTAAMNETAADTAAMNGPLAGPAAMAAAASGTAAVNGTAAVAARAAAAAGPAAAAETAAVAAVEIEDLQHPGEWLPLEEEQGGTYLLNSKDLCALPLLPKLMASGVDALKIEGRSRSPFYTAVITRAYRLAIDALCRGEAIPPESFEIVSSIPSRGYTTGLLEPPGPDEAQDYRQGSPYPGRWRLCGDIYAQEPGGRLHIIVKNRFTRSSRLLIYTPAGALEPDSTTLRDEESGLALEAAPGSGYRVTLDFNQKIEPATALLLTSGEPPSPLKARHRQHRP